MPGKAFCHGPILRTLYLLLPAYNEAESIATLLAKIDTVASAHPGPVRIVVCNDGSRDSTADLLADWSGHAQLVVLTHRLNRGLGETMRDLFEYAAEHADAADAVVRMDCDDTHDPAYIPAMLQKLDEGFDVVIASRFQEGGGQIGLDAYRRFVSLSANLFMRLFFPVKGVREYSCGFRAYRGAIVKRAVSFFGNDFVQLKGFGFACTLEKLVKLSILGARFGEVPFVLRYDQKLSSSKMVGSVTTLGYMVMVVLHHWPWGGWRSYYRPLAARSHENA